ncbi:MAG TPA: PPOX class F420-dependent oxidoreductase [Dehalococcoidia bacterium]|nr:PPOX class F420-dependent oxidoreductase [Dehalococcoidia bacterium]
MNEAEAREFIRRSHKAVLTTIRRDGRPQMSNISYLLDHDDRIKISVTETRAKTKNLRRDPRAGLSIQGDNWYQYICVDGRATIKSGPPLADLRHVYERIAGKPHPNWEEFDRAMIDDQRCLLEITIDRIYPLTQ